MNKTNNDQPTQADIDGWKAQHKNVYQIEVDGRSAYLRKPGRKDLDYASRAGDGAFKFNEALMKTCWLGGDLEIQNDDDLFLAASAQLGEIVKVQQATLKKL